MDNVWIKLSRVRLGYTIVVPFSSTWWCCTWINISMLISTSLFNRIHFILLSSFGWALGFSSVEAYTIYSMTTWFSTTAFASGSQYLLWFLPVSAFIFSNGSSCHCHWLDWSSFFSSTLKSHNRWVAIKIKII